MCGMCFTTCLLFLFFELSLSQSDRKFLQEYATWRKEKNLTRGVRAKLLDKRFATLQAKNSLGAGKFYTQWTEEHPRATCMNWGILPGQDDGTLPDGEDVTDTNLPTLEALSLQL